MIKFTESRREGGSGMRVRMFSRTASCDLVPSISHLAFLVKNASARFLTVGIFDSFGRFRGAPLRHRAELAGRAPAIRYTALIPSTPSLI
jgi:hypothetical protein